jgi:hypothetical protein
VRRLQRRRRRARSARALAARPPALRRTLCARSLQYWGRVTGSTADYIIAVGRFREGKAGAPPPARYYFMCVPARLTASLER